MKRNRKHFFVNQDLQTGLISKVYLTVLLLTFILSVGMYFAILFRLDKEANRTANAVEHVETGEEGASALANTPPPQKVRILNNTKKNIALDLLALFLINVAVSFILVVFVFLFTSHTIAGPVHRLKGTFLAMLKGDLTPRINLRKNDEMKDLAETYNEMMETLTKEITMMKTLTASIKNEVGKTTINKQSLSREVNLLEKRLNQFICKNEETDE